MAQISAIFTCGDFQQLAEPYSSNWHKSTRPPPVYAQLTSATVGAAYQATALGRVSVLDPAPYFPTQATTCGTAIGKNGYFLLPANLSLNGLSESSDRNNGLESSAQARAPTAFILDVFLEGNSVASVTDVFGSNTRDAGSWQISQSGGYTYVTCTSFGTSANPPIFVPYSQGTASNVGAVPDIWKVTIKNNQGDEIASQMLPPGVVTRYPEAVFSSSVLTVTDTYCVEVERRNYESVANPTSDMQKLQIYTVLTAPVTTAGGGGTNMFSWLNNDYWYLTDLQVNLGTRAVTHRHGTLELRPNDTVNFAVLFHDGSAGKDPVATDLRLAVRSASNASAYYFWANPSVTTTSVSGDIYYSITVTASDEDLLAAQAAGLLAGSNASQTLLAEVQWTTTRGTFTSDTFNITVANEVVRDPDV